MCAFVFVYLFNACHLQRYEESFANVMIIVRDFNIVTYCLLISIKLDEFTVSLFTLS